jgi:hypothetical protein
VLPSGAVIIYAFRPQWQPPRNGLEDMSDIYLGSFAPDTTGVLRKPVILAEEQFKTADLHSGMSRGYCLDLRTQRSRASGKLVKDVDVCSSVPDSTSNEENGLEAPEGLSKAAV